MTIFESYKVVCCDLLKGDNPEGIETIFSLMRTLHPDFHRYFSAQYPVWVLNNYFWPALSGKYSEAVLLDWTQQEPEWQERLKVALQAGRSGPVVGIMRTAILQFAKVRETIPGSGGIHK